MESPIYDIEGFSKKNDLKSFQKIYHISRNSEIRKWFWGILIGGGIFLLLPWTQNIRAKGKVTTLNQYERPQEINALISGRIAKWYKREGESVEAGDTILVLNEIKPEYLDPNLINNTKVQLNQKQLSAEGYMQKAATADLQNQALIEAKAFKLQSLDNKITQQRLKIQNDSAEIIAIKTELAAYQRQIDAARKLYENGAISLVELEKRSVNFQNSTAKIAISQNKLMQSRQELSNLFIEKNSVIQEYNDKIAKTQGDKFSAISSAASSEADVAKLENQFQNYSIRNEMYIVRAPQSGQLVFANKSGIGEVVKEGERIINIVPKDQSKAVEIFVDPVDLPLIQLGQPVRFIFDGYPAIVFSGWPQTYFGTFAGNVSAIESNVSINGKFRVLVAEDKSYKKWPKTMRMGNGAKGIALMKNVPIFYEIWRNINGFPPEYYIQENTKNNKK